MRKVAKIRSSILLLFSVVINCSNNNCKKIEDYENNETYVGVNIDLNRDGELDWIFYKKPFEGDEMVFFIKHGDKYMFELSTINFSEDGGRVVKEVIPVLNKNNILIVKTYFPDRGINNMNFYIDYKDGDWIVNQSISEIVNWQEDPSKTIVCEVKQNVLLKDLVSANSATALNNVDSEDSKKKCYNRYLFKESVKQFAGNISEKNNSALEGNDRYIQLLNEFPLSKHNLIDHNNIAYFLEQRNLYNESVYILEKIIGMFPARTVAYINLGDAYWGLHEKGDAKKTH